MKQNKPYRNGGKHHYQNRPRYLKVGSTVYTHATASYKASKAFLCEARIVRQPTFYGGPYKLIICGVKLSNKNQYLPQGLLKLRLRRRDDAIIRQLNAFSEYEGQHWVRLNQVDSDQFLQQAISLIKREKLIQATGRNGWLVSKQRR